MALLSPSVARMSASLITSIRLLEELGCQSVHIDACHDMTLPNFFDLREVRTAWSQHARVSASLHIFQLNNSLPDVSFLTSKDLAMLHLFPETAPSFIEGFVAVSQESGCRVGLAVDVRTKLDVVVPYLDLLDTVFMMAIPVATYGREPDRRLNERIKGIRDMIEKLRSPCRLGIDGGVSNNTFHAMTNMVDELVVGSILFDSTDLPSRWAELSSIADCAKEKT